MHDSVPIETPGRVKRQKHKSNLNLACMHDSDNYDIVDCVCHSIKAISLIMGQIKAVSLKMAFSFNIKAAHQC